LRACYLKLNGGAKALGRSKLVGPLDFPLTNLGYGAVRLGGWRTQPASATPLPPEKRLINLLLLARACRGVT
jgi:hypothetical protein